MADQLKISQNLPIVVLSLEARRNRMQLQGCPVSWKKDDFVSFLRGIDYRKLKLGESAGFCGTAEMIFFDTPEGWAQQAGALTALDGSLVEGWPIRALARDDGRHFA
jgi:hypothetical protein